MEMKPSSSETANNLPSKNLCITQKPVEMVRLLTGFTFEKPHATQVTQSAPCLYALKLKNLTELYFTEKGGALFPEGFTQIDAVPGPVGEKSPSQGICLTAARKAVKVGACAAASTIRGAFFYLAGP